MPSALLRACSASPGCPNLTTGGPCASCAQAREQRRGSAASRGYDASWRNLKARFISALIAADIPPVCGARLPGAPVTTHSRCAAEGRLNGRKLETDHIVPHGGDQARFRNLLNLQLLCHVDHSRKTLAEQRAAA